VNWDEAYEELANGETIASPSLGYAYKKIQTCEYGSDIVMYGIWHDGDVIKIDVYDCYGEHESGNKQDIAATDWVVAG